MPKVSESYKLNKKKEIMDATVRVLSKKALYEINMTDVIKEAELSKGGIYLYYKDIDEILVDVMNREFKANNFSEQLEAFRHKEYDLEDKIHKLLQLYASYLQESSELAGKLQFELTILLTQNMERALRIREYVSIRKIGFSFTQELLAIISCYLDSKKVKDMFIYIQCVLDGALESYVLNRCYQFDESSIDLENVMDMLAENVIQMIKKESARCN